jgi:iron complex outermembrane recepter protein
MFARAMKRCAFAGCAFAGFVCCALLSVSAMADAPRRSISIPADDLVASLELLALQSGIEFIYDADQLKGIKAPGVSGNLTPLAAVMKLLEGTTLTVTEHNGAMLIAAPRAGGQPAANPMRSIPGNAVPPAQQLSNEHETVSAITGSSDADQKSSRSSSLDEIIVTGTHIRGEVPVGSALTVYARADIEQTGSATLDQFARNMTENFSGTDTISNQSSNIRFSPTSSSNGINTFQGASFNLHGLGPGTTLTLLNGQRLAPGGLDGAFTDISQIPLSAVDHIEVLPDGASAIYGADAVAGVVNIITRRDFTGVQTTIRYGGATEGGADEVTASQLLGKSWSSGNVLLNYEFDDQNGLTASQRTYVPDLGGPYSLIPENRRHSIFISGSQEWGERTTLSGDVLYSDREFSDASTFSSPVDFSMRRTLASGSSRQLSATAAFDRALMGDWHAQLTGNYSRNQQKSNAATAILDGSGNHSEVLVQGVTPSIIDVNAIAQGPLLAIPGGLVKAAFGASSRTERFESIDLDTTSGQTISSGEPGSRREVLSIYGEIVAPIIGEANAVPGYRRLDISLAGRFDHYSDFGSTANPKLGLSWEFIPGLYFKGTFGASFQAPLLSQAHTPLSVETKLLPDGASAGGSADALIIQGGNLDLLPERSKSFTAGFDLKPTVLQGYAFGLNFFHIRFTSKITTPPTSSGGNYSLSDPLLLPFVTRDPSLALVQGYFNSPQFSGDLAGLGPSAVQAILDDRLTNLAATVESGVDLTIRYSLPLHPCRLNLSLGVERLLENSNHTVYFAPVVSLLSSFAEPPKWKGRAGAVWTEGPFMASASVSYVNSYLNSLFTPPESIGSWTTADIYLSYKTGEAVPLPIRRLTIALSITNVADEHPPRVQIPASFTLPGESVIPFDPANASPVGRGISLSVDKRW